MLYEKKKITRKERILSFRRTSIDLRKLCSKRQPLNRFCGGKFRPGADAELFTSQT